LLFATEEESFLFSHAGYGDWPYSDNEDCEWVIEGEEEGPIELTFTTFTVEDEADCSFDFVEVRASLFPCFLNHDSPRHAQASKD
jgi:hypothetical protein